jgi:hypothetical protein
MSVVLHRALAGRLRGAPSLPEYAQTPIGDPDEDEGYDDGDEEEDDEDDEEPLQVAPSRLGGDGHGQRS